MLVAHELWRSLHQTEKARAKYGFMIDASFAEVDSGRLNFVQHLIP